MAKKKVIKNLKILVSLLIIVATIGLLIGKGYTAEDNHYCVTVQKNEATNNDDNLQVTERIVKSAGQQFYDSKTLDYEVELKNISESKSTYYNRVAIDIDTSYSMETNDPTGRAKELAKELSQKLIQNSTNINISVVTNNAIKANLTNSTQSINAAIDGLAMGESQVGEKGLDFAYSSLSGNPENSNETANVNKYIIVFTDSTDDVEQKMKYLTGNDSDLKIITVLLNATSTSYIKNAKPVVGDVYYIDTDNETNGSEATQTTEEPSTTIENNSLENNVVEDQTTVVPDGTEKYDADKIVDGISETIQDITVSDVFDDTILQAFTISDFSTADRSDIQRNSNEITSEVKQNKDGYVWKVNKLRANDKIILKFKITLKTEQKLDVGLIFKDVSTNKEQNIMYSKLQKDDNTIKSYSLEGIDGRKSNNILKQKESTVIRICYGYELKIKAVNEANTEVGVEGIQIHVIGKQKEVAADGTVTYGDTVCDIIKTADMDGYITITQEEAQAMRDSGTIEYNATAIVNKVGYESTDPIIFDVISDSQSRTLDVDNHGSNLKYEMTEKTRIVSIEYPITCTKADFEIQAQELNNGNVTLSDCGFELIQPKLNNHYEMNILKGTTDENGILHFLPTVMTEDGTYNYILRQTSTQDKYEITPLTLISVTYTNGKITTNPTIQFNSDVTAEISKNIPENHVIITVGNKCLAEDPFNFQINLKDNNDGTPLEGVTYLVNAINAYGQERKEYVTTDSNGQINTKIYGTGFVTIQVTEQTPKTGYVPDTKIKESTVQRVDGTLSIKYTDGTGTYDYLDNDKTSLKLDLTSQKKSEQNIVSLELVDSDEQDIGIGKNIAYTLEDAETGKIYGPTATDKNGKLSFTIDQKEEGQHKYLLKVDEDTIPEEYNASKVEKTIDFNLSFDKTGYIDNGDIINGTNSTVIDSHYSKVTNDKSTEYTYFIKATYELDKSKVAQFKLQLADKDTGAAIKDAKYDIDIEWNVEGSTETKTKAIKERKTNASGEITTYINKAKEVKITIKQVSTLMGYTCDSTTQEIILHYNNNGIIQIEQGPYDLGKTNTSEPNEGAYAENGIVIFKHLNKKRSEDDTYVNLTITKQDMNKSYVNGVNIGLQSDSLQNADKSTLTYEKDRFETGAQGSEGTVTIDYKKWKDDPQNNYIIRVPGLSALLDGQEKTFNLDINEMVTTDGQKYTVRGDASKVTLRLTFRKKENRIKLTNVEAIYGNRLIINENGNTKSFSSASDDETGKEEEDNLGVYLGNIFLPLYYNFDDIGNLSLDLKKQDKDSRELAGAKYDVQIVNPDGTKVIKKGIKVTNGDSGTDIELSGLSVSKGSYIYITEQEAPIGYDVNQNTETLEVTNINEEGEITLVQQNSSYNPNRLSIKQLASTPLEKGLKSNYQLTLTDYQLDTFEFGIKALDSADKTTGISGYTFKIETSMGATNSLTTNEEGNGTAKVGGSGYDKTITYTISTEKVAKYYKPMSTNIKVNVVFDEFGHIDADKTVNAQTDTNYKKLWNIDTLTSDENGKISISLYVDHLPTLNVKVQTKDKITNTNIADAEYQITPSVTEAKGTDINVGYALEDGVEKYTLEQKHVKDTYQGISNKMFSLRYDKEVVKEITASTISAEEGNITITGTRQITIVIYAEPKVPFEITNKYYFDNSVKLQGANFKITDPKTNVETTGTTNTNGITGIYSGILGTNEEIIYKVEETFSATGYARIDGTFYVKVKYDDNRAITDAQLTDEHGNAVTNKFIQVNFAKTSTFSTYNSNDKGIVKIEILNYPEFKINIKDIDRRDDTTPIAGTTYSVTSEYNDSNNSVIQYNSTTDVVTDATGFGIAHLNSTRDNTIVTYIIKEDIAATGYQTIGTDTDKINENKIRIKVTFDENGYVKDVELVNADRFGKIAAVSKVETITNDKERFIINLELKNNPILKINIDVKDSADHSKSLGSGIGFTIIGKEGNTTYTNSSKTNKVNITGKLETIETDSKGRTAGYLDRTLDNKQMTYEITETQKPTGYEWATDSHSLLLNVTFDANGKLSNVVSDGNANFVEVISFNKDNFEININVYNEEVKEFGMSVTAIDAYDSNKKIDNLKINAYLVDTEDTTGCITPDNKYKLMDTDNKELITGADRDNSGNPDIAHGEDYETIGKFEEKSAQTRNLRLVILNDSQGPANSKGTYYLDSTDESKSGKNIGYYKGTKYYENAKYQTVAYQYLITVSFDDEGKIADAKLNTGLNEHIGWLVDNQYVQTDEKDKVSIDHTDYKLNITLKLFPLFELNASAMNNYTYNSEIKENGKPIKLDGAKYTISTAQRSAGEDLEQYVKAGYVGLRTTI